IGVEPGGMRDREHSRWRRSRALFSVSRGTTIAVIFIAVQMAIVLVGTASLEAVNILRSYAAGESQWSKAQKNAIISLSRFADTRAETDFATFESSMGVIEGDGRALDALLLSRPDRVAALQGFIEGGNHHADAPGLVWGFLLFNKWGPFAAAVQDWQHGQVLAAQLRHVGNAVHEEKRADATHILLAAAAKLDRELEQNERGFEAQMGEASREAAALTLLGFVLLSVVACAM